MENQDDLLKKIEELERKIKKLEEKLREVNKEDEWMEALYQKAKNLVKKDGKTTWIFLQRKLLIDMPRAESMLQKMEDEGMLIKDPISGIRKLKNG